MSKLRLAALGGTIVLALGLAACGNDSVPLSGSIRIDGSTTVAPLTRAIASRFVDEHPGVHISVGASGTAVGFERLCRGRADASNAIAPIDAAMSRACRSAGVEPAEIAVANDAVMLIVNRENPISCLTTEQLSQIWRPDSTITTNWLEVPGTDPPYDARFTPWGPGTDTETFDFFTTAVNGKEGGTRDYNNVLHHELDTVTMVAGTAGFIGYADHPFYAARPRTVKTLALDSGHGCVAPSPATIADGTFRPLSRRLFVYPSAKALARPAMAAFMRFYLDNVESLAPRVGFIALTGAQLDASRATLERLVAG